MPIMADAWKYTRLPHPPGLRELAFVAVAFAVMTVIMTVGLRRALEPRSTKLPKRK